MNPTPENAPDSPQRTARQDAARVSAVEAAAQRRGRRHGTEPSAVTAGRRWRFTDAVTAARQLSAGGAASG